MARKGSNCDFCYDCYPSIQSLVETIPLNLGDAPACLMDKSSAIVDALTGVDLPPTNGTGLVGHVSFVMFVLP